MGKEYPELSLSPDLADLLKVEPEEVYTVAMGSQLTQAVIEVGDDNSQRLAAVSPEMALALGIPADMDLNIRNDGGKLRLGPLVGIMAELFDRQHSSFGSQNTFFQGLLSSLQRLHGFGYVFTPQDINWVKNRIHGYYLPAGRSSWQRRWFPFPDVCYNRYFKNSKSSPPKNPVTMAKLQSRVKTFNPAIGTKMAVHKMLAQHSGIAAHLPDTRTLSSYNLLNTMLRLHREVYVKPINGSKGEGIARVTRRNPRYLVKTSDSSRETECVNLTEVMRLVRSVSPNRPLMVQQAIKVSGLPHFDFRVLVQKDRRGLWSVTGIAARVGSRSQITTNLHTGGQAATLPQVLNGRGFSGNQIAAIQQEMESLALQIARCVSAHFRLLGELGLDFIVDRRGKVWFLEANPKPSRYSFAQIDKDLRRLAISRPMEYAFYLSGF